MRRAPASSTSPTAKKRPGGLIQPVDLLRLLEDAEARGDRWAMTAWCLHLHCLELEDVLTAHGLALPLRRPLPCCPTPRSTVPCCK